MVPVKEETLRKENLFSSLMPNNLLISCLGERHATCSEAETKRCVSESRAVEEGVLVGFVAAISFAETKEGQDKRSCKQSADQRSNTCAPCLQHTYGERLWGREMKECENGVGRGCPLEWKEIANLSIQI